MKNSKRGLLVLFFVMTCFCLYPQANKHDVSLGIRSGTGNEIKNSDYSFTNQYYKIAVNYLVKSSASISYELVLQPEVNFGTHQLLNFYFVTPDQENYIEKRERFTQVKNVNQYVLNIGFLIRKTVGKTVSIYVQGSVGPMISDTETERLSKGFAFSDVFALGMSFNYKEIRLDVVPSLRHVSNAGTQRSNAGFNTKNIELGLSYRL
jgi:hypothetical protein